MALDQGASERRANAQAGNRVRCERASVRAIEVASERGERGEV